ncbi:xylulokinase [Leucothrix arctica]|uniref:Xylulose kinase n=1 Tax=Leucothrix arctica TaxID=1481894 RepID=A0A317CN37_9GAMM|nr:xylulokinase [Leucothrix arctica]PWQ99729.1 xylulokinase [Leucothrix arctica]
MFIGIDIGTSGVKTLLMDERQHIIASSHASIDISRPHSGWSEQDPEAWIRATKETLDTLKQSHGSQLSAVTAMGLSGQMHGATLLDKQDKVLRPCMLWNDTRSSVEAAAMDANPIFQTISGNIVFPGFTAPKVAWVKNNEPEIFSQIHKVLLPKDYVRLWLTGEYVTDMSDASGTSWLDVEKRKWSPELLAACDMSEDQMPSLVEGSEVSGQLRDELVQRWALSIAPVVAGGAGDNAASACGLGVVDEGQAFISLGTSGVLFAANSRYSPNPKSAVHAFCHAIPNAWHQMGVILSAADSLSWYSKITGLSPQALTEELGTELQSPSGLYFLPYLAGERTPHNDASVRGAFIGMDHSHDRKALTQAVLEGVIFAIRDNMEALAASGTQFTELAAVGGGSRSHYWLKILATALNMPVNIPVKGDFGGAFGAARLAMMAATKASPSVVLSSPAIEYRIEPVSALVNQYDASYQTYKQLYPAIKNVLS